MKYTLITANGKVLTFFILDAAKTFQMAFGGEIITNEIVSVQDSKRVIACANNQKTL